MIISVDIIILGSGIVGLTMANLCARYGFKVAMVETTEPNVSEIISNSAYDIRCSSITPTSEKILMEIDVWNDMIAQRVSPYRKMVVWDGVGFGEITFDAEEINENRLGHIIENKVILKVLWDKAKLHPNIHFFCPSKTISIAENKLDPEKIILEIADLTTQVSKVISLRADVIIGADGVHSWLREKIGYPYIRHSYHQKALVATVRSEMPHKQTAWQRFLAEGPIAYLPLAEPNSGSIVWTSGEQTTEQYLQLPEQTLCRVLSKALDYRLGKIEKIFDCSSFPLMKQHVKQYTKNKTVLIGDAAHVVHPLAGQGLNLGLLDAKVLQEVLLSGKEQNYPLGHTILLNRYQRLRKSHNIQMSTIMDFFNTVYKIENSVFLVLRGAGLSFMENNAWLKKKIMQWIS